MECFPHENIEIEMKCSMFWLCTRNFVGRVVFNAFKRGKNVRHFLLNIFQIIRLIETILSLRHQIRMGKKVFISDLYASAFMDYYWASKKYFVRIWIYTAPPSPQTRRHMEMNNNADDDLESEWECEKDNILGQSRNATDLWLSNRVLFCACICVRKRAVLTLFSSSSSSLACDEIARFQNSISMSSLSC